MTDELVKVAQLDQLPSGGCKLCTVADRRIALFHLDGTIYAIEMDTCMPCNYLRISLTGAQRLTQVNTKPG